MALSKEKWLFPKSTLEAKDSQKEMRQKVLLQNTVKEPISLIAGMDVSNKRFDPSKMLYAATVLLSFPTCSVVETATHAAEETLPYIPGLLGFREAPVLINAYMKLSQKPDLLMIDGHGVSHPRELGIASHIGVLLDIPTIGVAKSILVGAPEEPLGEEAGSTTPLVWKGKKIASLFRSKRGCLPLIISAGHKITLEYALEIVKNVLKGYRLPEPTRRAHFAANDYRRALQKNLPSSSLL